MGERLNGIQEAVSSNLIISTICKGFEYYSKPLFLSAYVVRHIKLDGFYAYVEEILI